MDMQHADLDYLTFPGNRYQELFINAFGVDTLEELTFFADTLNRLTQIEKYLYPISQYYSAMGCD